MDPALLISPRWQKKYVTPIKAKDGYVTTKDLVKLQNVKDMLYGGINVDKHESNIIKNSLSGVKNYMDFKPEECKQRMNNLNHYSNQIQYVKKQVTQIDVKYFEKKKESNLPENRQQKKKEDGSVEKIKPIDYLPLQLFEKDKNEMIKELNQSCSNKKLVD